MKKFTLLLFLNFLALYSMAQTASFNWKIDTISEGNSIKGMTLNEADGTSVIIGYANTFLKSTDNGATWENKTMVETKFDFMGMSQTSDALFISSRKTKTINHPSEGFSDVYSSGVIMSSKDRGVTWELLDVSTMGTGDDAATNPNAKGAYWKDLYSIGALNKDTILAYSGWYEQTSGERTSQGAVFRTNNGGATWSTLTANLCSNIVSNIQVMDSIAVFGGLRNLVITNLHTDSITDIYPNLIVGTDSNLYVNNITMLNPNSFYVTTTSDGIFKTEDAGQTFTQLPGIAGSNDLIVINDSTLVTTGNSYKSKLSTDSGNTWINCYPGKTNYKIGGVLNDTLYVLTKSEAYKCAVSDLIAKVPSWKTVQLFDNEILQKMAIYDKNTAVIAGYGGNCMYTTDGGLNWKNSIFPANLKEDISFDYNSISANNANAYATIRRFKIANLSEVDTVNDLYMEGLLYKTSDNWETSTLIDASKIGENEGTDGSKNPQLDECWALNPFIVECVDANTSYLYANWYHASTIGKKETSGRVFKTNDGGDSWTVISPDYGDKYVTCIEFTADTGYIGGNKILEKTIDAGTSTIDLYPNLIAANNGDTTIYIKNIHMASAKEIYIPTTSDGVFITNNGGDTFTKFEGISGTNDILKLDNNSFLCMGTTSKSKFTNDGGTTWQNASPGISAFSIGEVLNDTLYTLGKGTVMKIALADLELKTGLPATISRPKLNILYGASTINVVSSDSEINRCTLYSITGRTMMIQEPNSRTCRFNTDDFKPGIYIINSFVKGKRYTNKVIVK